MARMYGMYSEDSDHPATVPDRVAITGKGVDEHDCVWSIPRAQQRHPVTADEVWTIVIPPDKSRVREIARRIELDCDDQRLIDWMKA